MAKRKKPEERYRKNGNGSYIYYHHSSYWPNNTEAINYAFRESLINGT